MTELYTPTTEEVLGMLGAYLYEYGAECDMNLPGNSPDEIVERWLAEHDRQISERAWERGVNDVCAAYAIARTRGYTENPYRKALEGDE